jgi:hypothetical protein
MNDIVEQTAKKVIKTLRRVKKQVIIANTGTYYIRIQSGPTIRISNHPITNSSHKICKYGIRADVHNGYHEIVTIMGKPHYEYSINYMSKIYNEILKDFNTKPNFYK